MKKRISSILTIMTLLLTMVINPISVEASESDEVSTIIDGSELLDESVEESSEEYYSRLRGVYLMKGSGMISKVSSTMVAANGSTTAHSVVDSITVYVYVERYTGSGWTTVSSWGVTEYNDYYVSTTKFVTVTSGYYYRVRSFHYAGGESTSGSTNGIKIA